MGFSIESPGFKDFARKLKTIDLGRVAYQAAEDLALERIVDDLTDAARYAGASRELRDDIGFYFERGNVFLGVPADAPSAREAFDLEYGTPDTAPTGWMRATFAQHQHDYNTEFQASLSRRLAKEWS